MDASKCGMDMQTQENNGAGEGADIEKRSKEKRPKQGRKVGRRLLRQRINAKLKVLRELIPNCSERGQASILDDAVKYIKNMELQLQMMMSMRAAWSIPRPPTMMPQSVQPEMQMPSPAPFLQTSMGGTSEMNYDIGTLWPSAAMMPQSVQLEMQIPRPTPFLQTPAGDIDEMKYEIGTLWPLVAMMPQQVEPEMQIPSLAPFLQTTSEDTDEMKDEIEMRTPDIFPSSCFPAGLPNSPFLPPSQ